MQSKIYIPYIYYESNYNHKDKYFKVTYKQGRGSEILLSVGKYSKYLL